MGRSWQMGKWHDTAVTANTRHAHIPRDRHPPGPGVSDTNNAKDSPSKRGELILPGYGARQIKVVNSVQASESWRFSVENIPISLACLGLPVDRISMRAEHRARRCLQASDESQLPQAKTGHSHVMRVSISFFKSAANLIKRQSKAQAKTESKTSMRARQLKWNRPNRRAHRYAANLIKDL